MAEGDKSTSVGCNSRNPEKWLHMGTHHPEPIDRLLSLLGSARYRFQNEEELQSGIEKQLSASGIHFRREVAITPKDRLDFLVGSTAIEVKVAGSLSDVTRQIHRYLQSDKIHSLILVTTRQAQRNLPRLLNGKEVRLLWLGGQAL